MPENKRGAKMAKAAVIMGSDSDWGVMQAAVKTLKSFRIEDRRIL